MQYLKKYLYNLISPRSDNEDLGRREFILNVLVLGSVFLSAISSLLVLYNAIKYGDLYRGIPLSVSLVILGLFGFIYILSRRGHAVIASYFFIFSYLSPTLFFLYKWGVDLPVGLLFFALIIVISGILISTKYAFKMTAFLSFFLMILIWLEHKEIIHPQLYWKLEVVDFGTASMYVVILFLISVIAWLSNREIEKSLRRARRSEAELKKERDNLELVVEERTKELKAAQMEKIAQLYRFAEFGRLSSGLFHDLINPLTALSLNLGQVEKEHSNNISDAKSYLSQAITVTKRMEEFVGAIRKQIQKQDVKKDFSLNEEINQSIQIFAYKARKAGIEIKFEETKKDIWMHGDQIKFSQLISNLLSNAIDSYDNMEASIVKRLIIVRMIGEEGGILLTVEDNGGGISGDIINQVFEPFFTTKGVEKGTGIGLSSSKYIVEKNFKGEIQLESKVGIGTKFTVRLPLVKA